MLLNRRRGFTLVELLIAIVLMSVVGLIAIRMLQGTQRAASAQTERSALQANTRATAMIIPSELREIDPTDPGDLPSWNQLSPGFPSFTSVQYRAMRGFGIVCEASVAATNTLKVYKSSFNGLTGAPRANRDYILVYADSNLTTTGSEYWVPLKITNVANGNCLTAGSPAAFVLTVSVPATVPATDLPGIGTALTGIVNAGAGTPARTFELMELSLYKPAGAGQRSWLGAHSVSANPAEAVQPVLGPLRDVDGVTFKFLGSDGNPAATRNAIRSMEVKVVSETSNRVHLSNVGTPTTVLDSLTMTVRFRNAPSGS